MDDNVIRAKWDVSGDPCPVVSYEWAIERTDGFVIQNFTDMAGTVEYLSNIYSFIKLFLRQYCWQRL